jgi:hypothetical protein
VVDFDHAIPLGTDRLAGRHMCSQRQASAPDIYPV